MKNNFWKVWDRFGLVIIIILFFIIMSILNSKFRTIDNIINVINQASIVAIAGAGMTFVIAAGFIDLSVGSIMALTACLGASIINYLGIGYSIPVFLLSGALLGCINGLIVTKFRVPAFIATLGMMVIIRGAVLFYTGGHDILINSGKIDAFGIIGSGSFLSIPMPIILMVFTFIIFQVILSYTSFGRHVCAIGSNYESAVSSGLNVDLIAIAVFAIAGISVALSGIIQTAQIKSVSGATAGLTFELQAIAVVILGGTSLKGGKGKLLGTMAGAILIALANNVLNLYNTPSYYQRLVIGILLLLAVSVDGIRQRAQTEIRGIEL